MIHISSNNYLVTCVGAPSEYKYPCFIFIILNINFLFSFFYFCYLDGEIRYTGADHRGKNYITNNNNQYRVIQYPTLWKRACNTQLIKYTHFVESSIPKELVKWELRSGNGWICIRYTHFPDKRQLGHSIKMRCHWFAHWFPHWFPHGPNIDLLRAVHQLLPYHQQLWDAVFYTIIKLWNLRFLIPS